MQENENPPVAETPKTEAKPTATEVFSKVATQTEPAKEGNAEAAKPTAKPAKPAKKKAAAPAKSAKKKSAAKPAPVKKKAKSKPAKKKSAAKPSKAKAKSGKKGKTRKPGKRGPKFKNYPKPTMISVKMTPEDMKILNKQAKRFTVGMVSAYVRHAATHYKARKGEKMRLKLRE